MSTDLKVTKIETSTINHFDEYRKIKELINTIINNDKVNNNM